MADDSGNWMAFPELLVELFTFYLPGPRGAHLGSKSGSRLVCFCEDTAVSAALFCAKRGFNEST